MDDINLITKEIIGKSFKVSNTLGNGFLEKVYQNALSYELTKSGLNVKQQYPLEVFYEDKVVGEYFADLLVENKIILELKATKALEDIHLAQILNYLKACDMNFGLLINFGTPRVEIKRVVNNY
ncbi:GxxExxY protein [Cognataquiflexum rubidum]|jgi:GxxExxY protein|uniref:GxxExxY protein n=1 Tax=Cognataquiflexum rubidum TaxID=2922273 RepID=UPI001F13AC84|nr:GxxExxY protein [Cognataquiflexum rubidum]MCH6233782.1 GxxExxY protein [Cognataquiflexum rubidum]